MVVFLKAIDRVGIDVFRKPKSRKLLWDTWSNCNFSSSSKPSPPNAGSGNSSSSILNQPSMSEPLTGLPQAIYSTAKEENHTTQVTTLPNGIRVASENRFGQFCTIGVLIDSGCRYEAAYPTGVSHFLEKLAFNSTTNFPDRDNILIELEKCGGISDCQASRDSIVYAATVDIKAVDPVTKILGDAILRPKLTVEEVDAARQTVEFEIETYLTRPEQEPILMDMIHAAAYKDNTLGIPKLCPAQNFKIINREILFKFLKNHYTPKRMVVAGVGVDHDKLVKSVSRYFEAEKPIWVDNPSLAGLKTEPPDDSIAQYIGGLVQEECDIPLHAAQSGLPELAHVVIGFEGFSHLDPDFIPICLLNMIMGGGGSFSAGGPGKGMFTRLYINVLNRYHWMFSATTYNHVYSDTGLFCIHASAPPEYFRDMVQVIIQEMLNMSGEICPMELRRAKTQLQSMLWMNLESRAIMFEDIARQVLSVNHRKRPEYFLEAIENVTEDDIRRVAKKLLRTKPCVAARGDLRKMPSYDDIQAAVLNLEGKLPDSKGRSFLSW